MTASDVAGAVGIDIASASKALLEVAYAVGADMDVTTDGDIVYSFPTDVKSRLASSSIKYKLQSLKRAAAPVLRKVFAVSFGVVFLSTTMLVFSTLVMLASSQSSESNDGKGSRQLRSSGATVDIPLRMLLDSANEFLFYSSRYNDNAGGDLQLQRRRLSFMESFYSFFFGDGDSNKYLELVQFQSIASLIRNQGGVVYAEQLNPFIVEPPQLSKYLSSMDETTVDEKHIIPLLLTYNGVPAVTEEGQLLYRFQELMTTAKQTAPSASVLAADRLDEKQEVFSLCSPQQIAVAASLGVFNIIGLAAIGRKLQAIGMTVPAVQQLQYITLIRTLYPFLIGYSFLYIAIPLGRFIATSIRNRSVDRRNASRMEWAQFLKSPQGKGIIASKEKAKESMARTIRTTHDNDNNDNKDNKDNKEGVFYSTRQEL